MKKKVDKYHKRFCSTYVPRSKLQSLDDLSLLESIQLDDINNQPHHDFQAKDSWQQGLGELTLLKFQNAAKYKQLQE